MCSFLLETCPWKPAWDILQDRKQIYPEGSRNSALIKSLHGLFGECDKGIVRLLNFDSICNAQNSSAKQACFQMILLVPRQSQTKQMTYCLMWWKKLSGVTSSRRKKAWTSRCWVGRYWETVFIWKCSWKAFLCFRHDTPYGRRGKMKSDFMLPRTDLLINSLRWKECDYVQFHQHRHSQSVWVICRSFFEQLPGLLEGSQNQKGLAKDIKIYHVT